jgi:CRP-like cAMP-binding protein
MNAAHVSTTSEREDQLAKVPFFDGLTREALSIIAQVTAEEAHALGTRIFQYGDPGDKLFIILEGKVRISREVAGMGEEALAVLGAGQVFGEMALLDESTRSADARAHERCLRGPALHAQGPRLRGPLGVRPHAERPST